MLHHGPGDWGMTTNLTPPKCWVIIETGANQRYIFGTNKRRANIGASEIVHRVGASWTTDALEQVQGVTPVVQASGKAILVAASQSAGQDFVEVVTARALREAPGLGVWGVVHPVTSGGDFGLQDAHLALALARANGTHPELRFQAMPFSQPCVFTGLPAATVGAVGSDRDQPMSAPFASVFKVKGRDKQGPSTDGLERLTAIVCKGGQSVMSAVPTKLDARAATGGTTNIESGLDPVQNAGWVAIVHADGNGIGNLFLKIAEKCRDDEILDTLGDFSGDLNDVTENAVAAAAVIAAQQYEQRYERMPEAWLLPVIVGGDDVTVILDGRMALDFTEAFLREFEKLARGKSTIHEVNRAVNGDAAPPVTASAGIAYIKPHHPFSDGYDLAEQLCSSAKDLTRVSGNASALDYHVLFDSVGRDVDAIRQSMVVKASDGSSRLRLWSGPVLLEGAANIVTLREAIQTFGKARDEVSSTAAHALRSALAIGGPTIEKTLSQRGLSRSARTLVEADDDHLYPGGKRSWLIDSLALDEVARGVSR